MSDLSTFPGKKHKTKMEPNNEGKKTSFSNFSFLKKSGTQKKLSGWLMNFSWEKKKLKLFFSTFRRKKISIMGECLTLKLFPGKENRTFGTK